MGKRKAAGPRTTDDRPEEVQRRDRRFFGVGYPLPSDGFVTIRMRANRSRDTRPELLLRSALHRAGLRFRVHYSVRVDGGRAVVVDVAFTRRRLAVFVDGCFWHACPVHSVTPKANSTYWGPKLSSNAERDLETVRRLERAGWEVIRVWEHEDVSVAAARIGNQVGRILRR